MEVGAGKQDTSGSVWRENFSKLLLIKHKLDFGVELKTSIICQFGQWVMDGGGSGGGRDLHLHQEIWMDAEAAVW